MTTTALATQPMTRISVSEINTYLQCARRWGFRYQESLESTGSNPLLASGKAVHATVEALLRPTIWPSEIEARVEAILQDEFAGRENVQELVTKFLPGAVRAVERFPAELFGDPSWHIEEMLEATVGDITVYGIPDFVRWGKDEIVVYELKSTSDKDKDIRDYFLWNPQHRYYAAMIGTKTNLPVFVEYIVVYTGKEEVPAQRARWLMKPDLMQETRQDILDACLAITSPGRLLPSYSIQCRWCDYRSLCEARIEGRGEQDAKLSKFTLRERKFQ